MRSKATHGAKPDRAGRILAAADSLFCERGFAGVSLRDVAQAAEVNKGLILYYHDNKAALFQAVLQRYYEAHAEALEREARGDLPLRERVHALMDGYFDFMDENRRYARLIQQEVARSALGDVLPATGPLSAKHFFLSLAGITINYYTYAPVLRPLWDQDPLGADGRAERRAHVRWVIDRLLDGLEESPPA
jgi:AcrR family transcriptional regulator